MKYQTRLVFVVAFLFVFSESSAAKLKQPVAVAPITTTQPAAANAQAADDDTHGLVIAIRPSGFSPDQIEVTQGRYIVIVQNRSGIRDLTFRLERENGDRLHEVRPQELRWKKTFDLSPGRYLLSVVARPSWRCVLTVTAR